MPAREDVLRDAQVLEARRLLVHRADPEPMRRRRVREPLLLAVHEHLARVRLDHAGQRLHQRRLPGAVLADEPVHRPSVDAQVDVGDGLHAAVALGDAAQLDERSAHRGYAAVTPPSTLTMLPVDFEERAEAKNAIASATSSG